MGIEKNQTMSVKRSGHATFLHHNIRSVAINFQTKCSLMSCSRNTNIAVMLSKCQKSSKTTTIRISVFFCNKHNSTFASGEAAFCERTRISF